MDSKPVSLVSRFLGNILINVIFYKLVFLVCFHLPTSAAGLCLVKKEQTAQSQSQPFPASVTRMTHCSSGSTVSLSALAPHLTSHGGQLKVALLIVRIQLFF